VGLFVGDIFCVRRSLRGVPISWVYPIHTKRRNRFLARRPSALYLTWIGTPPKCWRKRFWRGRRDAGWFLFGPSLCGAPGISGLPSGCMRASILTKHFYFPYRTAEWCSRGTSRMQCSTVQHGSRAARLDPKPAYSTSRYSWPSFLSSIGCIPPGWRQSSSRTGRRGQFVSVDEFGGEHQADALSLSLRQNFP
jgi:hypothetical protein